MVVIRYSEDPTANPGAPSCPRAAAGLCDVTASIAHELRQPLHFIRMSLEGIRLLDLEEGRVPPAPELADKLDQVLEQVERVNQLLHHLQAVGSDDADPDSDFSICDAVKTALRLEGPALAREGIVFSRACAFGSCPVVSGRRVLLEQVFVNLFANARRAIAALDRRHGRLSLSCALAATDGRIEIRLVDDGPGLPPELRERIFEPFFTTRPQGSGSGLGLYLCRRILAAMGGEISVADRNGKGAEFVIRLPVRRCGDTQMRGGDHGHCAC